jgi:hypothetical protein
VASWSPNSEGLPAKAFRELLKTYKGTLQWLIGYLRSRKSLVSRFHADLRRFRLQALPFGIAVVDNEQLASRVIAGLHCRCVSGAENRCSRPASMKPTAPERLTTSAFAADPVRGLSLSR